LNFRSKPLLQAITIPAQIGQPKGLLVGLHGWGANAQDLAAVAPLLQLPDYTLIFPDAPCPHPYSPSGRMWYGFPDQYSFLGRPEFRDRPDLVGSRRQLTEWLQSLPAKTGVPLSQTMLVGFSQGGAMTLDVGSTLPLAALLVLSGYMHAPVPSIHPAITQVLIVHGRQDQVVPLIAAHHTRDHLLSLNVPVQYHEFDMGHEIRPVVLQVVQNFMEKRELYTSDIA
jgi:phospholipase/carboxylesterase